MIGRSPDRSRCCPTDSSTGASVKRSGRRRASPALLPESYFWCSVIDLRNWLGRRASPEARRWPGTGSKACTTGLGRRWGRLRGRRRRHRVHTDRNRWNAAACTGAGPGLPVHFHRRRWGRSRSTRTPPPPLPPSCTNIFSSLWLPFFELSSMSVMVVLPLLSPVLDASTLVVSCLVLVADLIVGLRRRHRWWPRVR